MYRFALKFQPPGLPNWGGCTFPDSSTLSLRCFAPG